MRLILPGKNTSTLMFRKFTFLFCFLFGTFQAFAQTPNLLFYALLSDDETVPAVSSPEADGIVNILFNADRTKMQISGLLTGLDGAVTAAGFYAGKKGENGPLLFDLLPLIDGRKIAGEVDLPAGLLAQLMPGQVYVNIQTSAHPSGELRGQFLGETDLNFKMHLDAANLVPPAASPGRGIGAFHFPVGSDDILFVFGTLDLSDVVTAASLYEGQPGENGTLVADLPVFPPATLVVGKYEFDTLPGGDFIQKCLDGKFYVVVKTAAFPNGELRGQVEYLGALNSVFNANGFGNVPQTNSQAFGFGYTEINGTLDTLTTTIVLNGLTPTAAAIRKAPANQTGPLIANQTLSNIPGIYKTSYPITPAELTDLLENRLYAEFSSAAFPNGEIRGQMINSLRKCYAFDLCGPQQVPPVNSGALGMAMFSVDQADCYINYRIVADGLTGPLTEAGIYDGNAGENGPRLYDVSPTLPRIEGESAISAIHGPLIEAEGAYISLLTAAHPDGEIRGQIRRGLSCPPIVGVEEAPVESVAVYPNPFGEELFVKMETSRPFDVRLLLHDGTGKLCLEQTLRADNMTARIETNGLPSGMYLVFLVDTGSGRTVWTGKTTKVR